MKRKYWRSQNAFRPIDSTTTTFFITPRRAKCRSNLGRTETESAKFRSTQFKNGYVLTGMPENPKNSEVSWAALSSTKKAKNLCSRLLGGFSSVGTLCGAISVIHAA